MAQQPDPETKQAVKDLLVNCCRQPMVSILQIIGTRDTDRHKLQAIALYCGTVLNEVNKTIEKDLC
jgi:hypothetical protein